MPPSSVTIHVESLSESWVLLSLLGGRGSRRADHERRQAKVRRRRRLEGERAQSSNFETGLTRALLHDAWAGVCTRQIRVGRIPVVCNDIASLHEATTQWKSFVGTWPSALSQALPVFRTDSPCLYRSTRGVPLLPYGVCHLPTQSAFPSPRRSPGSLCLSL